MSLIKKIKDVALVTGLSLALTGCVSTSKCKVSLKLPKMFTDLNYGSKARAEKILKTSEIETIPGGYLTDRWGKTQLVNSAGFLAGTIDITKIKDGYLSTGSYSEFQHPEALTMAAKYSDINKDKIVTEKEARNYYFNLCKKYAKEE